MTFTSHIAGKNASVSLYPDRLEWGKKSFMSTGQKAVAAVATAGLSYLATGVRGRDEGESIPVRSISHVSRRKSGFQTEVVVSTAAGDVAMRVSKGESELLISTLNALIAGVHPSQQSGATSVVAPMPAPAPSPAPVASQGGGMSLTELASLHAQGVLTDEEFAAAKRKALGI